MRRSERAISADEAKAILKKETYGVLSMVGEDGAPYGVPLNYWYSEADNALFIHCARVGRKTDAIGRDGRVSFAVVGKAKIDAEKLTTRYESVVAAGRASVITDDGEMRLRLRQFCDALITEAPLGDAVVEKYLPRMAIIRVDIDDLSGKANRG